MTPSDEFDWHAQSKAIRSSATTLACIAVAAVLAIGAAVWTATH